MTSQKRLSTPAGTDAKVRASSPAGTAPTTPSLSALIEQAAGLRRAQAMAGLAHVITAPDGSFESWSETLPELIGVQPDEVATNTKKWIEQIHPADRETFRQTALWARAERKRAYVEYRLCRKNSTWMNVRQVMEPIPGRTDEQGRTRWFNTLQDISEQKRAEERIRRLNRVYQVLSGINTLIVRVRDRDELFREACRIVVELGRFQMAWIGVVDPGAMKIVPMASAGAEPDFLTLFKDRFSLRDDVSLGNTLAARAVKEKKVIVSNEARDDPRIALLAKEMRREISSMAILPLMVSDEVVGVLVLLADEAGIFDEEEMRLLTELAGDIAFAINHIERDKKLNYLAYYDELTGLANRTLFIERVSQKLIAGGNVQSKVAVFALDVERFRTINDALGRQAGDVLLRQVADRLVQVGGDAGGFARIGADHFAVVVADVENEEQVARYTEERLNAYFGPPYQVAGQEMRISAKVGIAMFPNDGADADSLFRNAEAALKKAKAGGERYLFYAEEMTGRVAEKLSLENKLRQAIEKEEFVLHYQPKVDVETRQIVGVEALIRWQSPELGLVPPMKFIPLLEETGLILQVGSWALKQASLEYRGWVEEGLKPPRVAVNVSPIQLRQRDFVRNVEEAIMEGMAPVGIDLEITESLIMDDVQGNVEKLNAIRALGISIAIDDFGTGYSSLAYLARLPVETLKIDRAFIIKLAEEADAATLVQTMISLAHSLRLKVVAEGVETEEQAKMLRLLRCDQMQGYLFSKPLPLEQMTALLKAHA